MVSDGVAPQLKINFNTIQSYRIHGNRSKLDIYPLLSQQNCKKKIGSMNFQFFSVWRLYAHKLHAPCSHAPRSCSRASVVETYTQISLAAAEFFKVFLNHKNGLSCPMRTRSTGRTTRSQTPSANGRTAHGLRAAQLRLVWRLWT